MNTTEPTRVLHVDDDPDFVDLVAAFLEHEDDRIEVRTATGADEGLDLLDDDVDCVVSDYDVPGRNGIEFLEAVRGEYDELPFILFTGKGSEEIASEAVSAGVTDYLQKGSGTSQYTVLANRITNAVEQYRSRRELEASQQRLSLFIDQSPLGVIEWNGDFECVRMNDAGEDILGYSSDELAGRSWETIVPDSARDAVREVGTDLLDDDGGYHAVNENVRKDGERITCEWHNRVVTDGAGEVVAIFSQFQDVTERTEYERELRRQRDQFWAIFETIPYPIAHVRLSDGRHRVENVNPAFATTFGYDTADLEGCSLNDVIVPDSGKADADLIDRSVSADGITEREVERVTVDGRREFLFRARRLDVERGHEALGIYVDVTEQNEHERELERYETILKALGDPVYALDADGRYTFVNDAYVAELGYPEDEIIGEHVSYVVPEHEVERATDVVRGLLSDGGRNKATVEQEQVTAAGEHVRMETHIALLPPGEDGGFRGTAGVVRDITDRAERERELERYETVVEALGDPVYALDADGHFTFVNETYAELGYSKDDLIGSHTSRSSTRTTSGGDGR